MAGTSYELMGPAAVLMNGADARPFIGVVTTFMDAPLKAGVASSAVFFASRREALVRRPGGNVLRVSSNELLRYSALFDPADRLVSRRTS